MYFQHYFEVVVYYNVLVIPCLLGVYTGYTSYALEIINTLSSVSSIHPRYRQGIGDLYLDNQLTAYELLRKRESPVE